MPPLTVMDGKYVDTAMLCNFIHQNRENQDRLTLDDKGEITCETSLHIKDTSPLKDMIYHMLDSSLSLFEQHIEALTAVALTPKPYEAIRESIIK